MKRQTKIDALVAEIGSTTTVVSAFAGLFPGKVKPRLVAQATALTTVSEGDVTVGVNQAKKALEAKLGSAISCEVTLATSSAAGGLRMTVHGLTERMTARAAREAALGAGAVVIFQTAGKLRPSDVENVVKARPGLILLAGGVEGGDTETVLYNARMLAAASSWAGGRRPIIVYGGNSRVAEEVQSVLDQAGFRVHITSNVYPAVDRLDVEQARRVIHDAFEEHIVLAPGMGRVKEIVTGPLLPTPGAVLMAAEALAAKLGDLVVIDVGGATTDVHSVTDGSPEIQAIATDPQPHARRTVEGDLGTFVSAPHTASLLPPDDRPTKLPPALPTNEEEVAAARALARAAAQTAMIRHAGSLVPLYTPTGRKIVAEGRDLTACRLLIGTGGALTRLPRGIEILESTRGHPGSEKLLPPHDAICVLDRDYIMAACGILLQHADRDRVLAVLEKSLWPSHK